MSTNIVVAPDQSIYENTPVLTKVECAVIQQGVAASIYWQLRDRDGYPIDLAGLFHEESEVTNPNSNKPKHPAGKPHPIPLSVIDSMFDGTYHHHKSGSKHSEHKPSRSECDHVWSVLGSLNPAYYDGNGVVPPSEEFCIEVRIQPADEPVKPMWIVPATVVKPKNGILQFDVPHKVADTGGIFVLNIGVCRMDDKRPLYIHKGLLSVERSAWRASTVDCKMPTLSDIRMKIMDTETENLLQGYVEFTTADILDSVVSAVREWNGTTPYLANYTYTCHTFPWIEPWLNKIVSSLYQKAAFRYTRNKLQVAHGGVQGDDLARDKEYTAIAAEYDKRWKEWVMVKKRELNLGQFIGVVSSPYHLCRNSTGKHGY